MATALITGGTGFIGRRVARLLLGEGWKVILLTRPSSIIPPELVRDVQRLDLDSDVVRLTEKMKKIGPDVVIHLASMIVTDHQPDQAVDLLRSNVEVPVILLEAAIAAGCRAFVNTGTFWQFYRNREYWPVNLYAATKQAFEDLLVHYVDRYDIHAVTLILFDNYGRNDVRRKIIDLLVDAVHTGRSLEITAGEQILDLTHIDDIADAFLVAALRAMQPGQALAERFFVGGERIKLRDLVAKVEELTEGVSNIRLGVRAYPPRQIMDPINPSETQLPGWTRRKSLADELSEAVVIARN